MSDKASVPTTGLTRDPAWMAVIATISLAALSGAYVLGKDLGEKDAQIYKDISGMGLKELLDQSKVVVNQATITEARLAKTLEDSDLDGMKKRIDALTVEASNYKSDLEKVRRDNLSKAASLKLAEDEIKRMLQRSEPITINVGEAIQVVPDTLTVGVLSTYTSWAAITINGENSNPNVGVSIATTRNGKSCQVELIRVDQDKSATVTCKCQ